MAMAKHSLDAVLLSLGVINTTHNDDFAKNRPEIFQFQAKLRYHAAASLGVRGNPGYISHYFQNERHLCWEATGQG